VNGSGGGDRLRAQCTSKVMMPIDSGGIAEGSQIESFHTWRQNRHEVLGWKMNAMASGTNGLCRRDWKIDNIPNSVDLCGKELVPLARRPVGDWTDDSIGVCADASTSGKTSMLCECPCASRRVQIHWTIITSGHVVGDKSCFVARIFLFLEYGRFLETPALSFHVRSNVTPLAFDDFLTVLPGDLQCITADNSNDMKLQALDFKCGILLTKFSISPDVDYALTQHENHIELLTHVRDLPLPGTDKSLESYVTALPDGSGLSRASWFQSSRRLIPPSLPVALSFPSRTGVTAI
jgi:hypothetical protein